MLRASLRLHAGLAPLTVMLAACGGKCDAPFHLSYYDETIVPTHEFVRSDGRHILFGEYEYDEFEDSGEVAAAWVGTLDADGKATSGFHFGSISWMGDVWQRDDEQFVMLVNDDQAAPLLVELDRDARFIRSHVVDLVVDYGYPPDTKFELWGADGSDDGFLIYVPDRLARIGADLSTDWFMDLPFGARAAVAGDQTFLARPRDGAIVVDRIDSKASSEAQVTLASAEVGLELVAITASQGELLIAASSSDTPGSMYLVRLTDQLEIRYQAELLSYGANPAFVACLDEGRCAFSSWDEDKRRVSTMFLDADGETVSMIGYKARAPIRRLRGRHDHVEADHELPVGGPVFLTSDGADGCITSTDEPTFTRGERTLTVEPSEEPLDLQRDELLSDGSPRFDEPEETEELPAPETCQ